MPESRISCVYHDKNPKLELCCTSPSHTNTHNRALSLLFRVTPHHFLKKKSVAAVQYIAGLVEIACIPNLVRVPRQNPKLELSSTSPSHRTPTAHFPEADLPVAIHPWRCRGATPQAWWRKVPASRISCGYHDKTRN